MGQLYLTENIRSLIDACGAMPIEAREYLINIEWGLLLAEALDGEVAKDADKIKATLADEPKAQYVDEAAIAGWEIFKDRIVADFWAGGTRGHADAEVIQDALFRSVQPIVRATVHRIDGATRVDVDRLRAILADFGASDFTAIVGYETTDEIAVVTFDWAITPFPTRQIIDSDGRPTQAMLPMIEGIPIFTQNPPVLLA